MAKYDLNMEVEVPKAVERYMDAVQKDLCEAISFCKECPHWPRVVARIKKIDINTV